VAAQVTSVSTYGSGETVFFTTEMRPLGSDDPLGFKAYQLDSDGVSLLAEPGFSAVRSISSSADGQVRAVNWLNECSSGSHCFLDVQESTEIRIGETVRRFDGHAEISANGRFALLLRRTGYGFLVDEIEETLGVQRLRLDVPGSAPEPFGPNPRDRRLLKIADDGSILSRQPDGLMLHRLDGETVDLNIPLSGLGETWLLRDASGVVYETDTGGERQIRWMNLGGADVLLVPDGEIVSVSRDDRTLLFAVEANGVRQVFLLGLAGGVGAKISESAAGVQSAALSDDGSVAYYFADGALLRASVGTREVLLGPLPHVDRPPYNIGRTRREVPRAVPGSTYRVFGSRLAERTTVAELPAGPGLGGFAVTVNGTPAAALWIAPDEIGYQVDWATELDPRSPAFVVSDETSGWEFAFPMQGVVPFAPETALPEVSGWSIAVHQDFDRLLTLQDQAAPGEYIHLYLTGLGEVSPPVSTGAPTPLSPLSWTTSECVSTASDGQGNTYELEVPFSGLAPGLTGYYQVTLRVPKVWNRPFFRPSCFAVQVPVNVRLAPMGP